MRDHSSNSRRAFEWEVGVDTGGTFTDCVARAATGVTCRSKVLSTAALRGVVVNVVGSSVTVELSALPDPQCVADFFRGFWLCPTGMNHAGTLHPTIDRARSCFDGRVECRLTPHRESGRSHTPLSPGMLVDLIAPFEAPILALRLALNRPHPASLADCRICVGTTRGTNALLEGRVSDVTLFINEGLEDLLAIGDQRRLDIFARTPTKSPTLEGRAIGVPIRMDPDGSETQPLNEALLRSRAAAARMRGAHIAAVALLHAGRSSLHEQRIVTILNEEGFDWVTASHQCGSTSRFEPRARAAVVDAALSGPVGEFIAALERDACGAEILMMTSAGGLLPEAAFSPRESLLSGPAGGVAAAAMIARACGFSRAVTLDMGGTSTDVARVDGVPELRDETTVGSTTIASPSIAVESVAAGGGSICWWDGSVLRVGPRSAGASPGPACYGGGGPLTITDVNLLLNRIDESHMPIPIIRSHAQSRADEVHAAVTSCGRRCTLQNLLESFVEIATEAMAGAIGTVTTRRGVDPADHALVCFGGAGGLHGCAVARRLGMSAVIFPHQAGLLCASGISQAPITRIVASLVLAPLAVFASRMSDAFHQLAARARSELETHGVDATEGVVSGEVAMIRLHGHEECVEIDVSEGGHATATEATLRSRFAERYKSVYGFDPDPHRHLEVERIRLRMEVARGEQHPVPLDSTRTLEEFIAPCSIMRRDASAFLAEGWSAREHPCGAIIMTPSAESAPMHSAEASRHEVISAQLTAIATDMGEQLRRTALSPNIKDRLDFSCGLLDHTGFLVVNAPHIPIHLGALGACVRAVATHSKCAPGDVLVVNHPGCGGSHLPDLTVITPIHNAVGELLGYAANRAHHAEIGGMRPGSMPPSATTLAQEGVVIPPTLLVEGGIACFDRVESLLRSGPWPSRLVEDNLADLRAQVAANELALQRVRALHALRGTPCIREAMTILRATARTASERAISTLPLDIGPLTERLDDGTSLVVRMHRSINPLRLTIDFSGSGSTHSGNLNAPIAVTRAAIMYSIRVLVGLDLGVDGPAFPMNEGLLDPVEIVVPHGTILAPDFSASPQVSPACAIGQTETSQRLVDLLWRAFQLAACSQGTVNNLLFGNSSFGFYETIGGGAGASVVGDGASGVHTHISNTRITDAEVLERRYPVRLERFSIRTNSGGVGAHRGGDGLVRRLRFLEPVELSFLSQHRIEQPFGMEGGFPGRCGAQRVIRASGITEELPGIVGISIEAGDAIEIETPGGGGFGTDARAQPSG